MIQIWYGSKQRFGHAGQSQRWVNILGRVQQPKNILSLTSSLNGAAPRPLSIGADKRRLAALGDFNIDLDVRDLRVGSNEIKVTATCQDGTHDQQVVDLIYLDQGLRLPYTINWREVTDIQDVAHVADGLWTITKGGISPVEMGYDRTVTLGDINWKDYEVTTSITVHGIHAHCYEYPSVHAGVGIVLRWKGHANWGSDGWASGQPVFGPSPYGAIGWHCVFHDDGPVLNFFDPDFQRPVQVSYPLVLHQAYIFKVRVETISPVESKYMLKVWPEATNEPATWTLETTIAHTGYKEGAVVLVAHHTACTFGDVVVSAL